MNNESIYLGDTKKKKFLNRIIERSENLTKELNQKMNSEASISLAKYGVLMAIFNSEDDEITMSNLSSELMVSNANMTGMTTRLKNDGLIHKKALPTGKRIYTIALTDHGHETIKKASQCYENWVTELMSSIDEDEIDLINGFLDKLNVKTEL